MIDRAIFSEAVARYLPQQRWFAGTRTALAKVELRDLELLNDDWPLLVWAIFTGVLKDGSSTDYQILAGLRPLGHLDFLEGVPTALMGEVPTELGDALAYNALHDPELCHLLLRRLAPDEHADYVRQTGAEVASSVLVYDERLLMRIFRRLGDGPNPDVETVRSLAAVGFRHVAAPIAGWRRGDIDLAVLREFVAGGAEGWQLALTSLRDLCDRRAEPWEAGGDLGPEMRRLGRVAAALHVALGTAFGDHPAEPARWADRLRARLDAVRGIDGIDAARIETLADRVQRVGDPGIAIRVHGDHTLRRVMRTDRGWYVLGFEGERPRSVEAASRVACPLEDVAGMLRSIYDATRMVLAERADEVDDRLVAIVDAWEQWNGKAYLEGYLAHPDIARLLPADESEGALLITGFEVLHALGRVRADAERRPAAVAHQVEVVSRLLDRVVTER